MPLCTQSDVEVFGQVDFTSEPDAAVTLWIASATAAIERWCGRPLELAGPVTEKITALGWHSIRLDRYPVVDIDSVTQDGTALVVDVDYLADMALGKLSRVTNGYARTWVYTAKLEGIVVVYTAGYDTTTVPDDLRMAAAIAVGDIFRAGQQWAASHGADRVTIEDVGSLDYGAGQAQDQSAVRFPADLGPEVRRLLSPYKRYHAGAGGRIA